MANVFEGRLQEPCRFIQAVTGPPQVGKTTLVGQVTGRLQVPVRFVSADCPTFATPVWPEQQWEAARLAVGIHGSAVLVVDEVQEVRGWDEAVKKLWDEDARALVEKVRGAVTIAWTVREGVRARLCVLKKYGYPPDMSEVAVKMVTVQAERST